MGAVGWGMAITGYQKALSIIAGLVIILTALSMTSFRLSFSSGKLYTQFLQFVKSKMAHHLSVNNGFSAVKVGFLNGLLPCGLVYIALAGATSTDSPLSGGLYMMLFGLGTMPSMALVMYFGKVYSDKFLRFRKWIPLALILFGLILIFRGIAVNVPGM